MMNLLLRSISACGVWLSLSLLTSSIGFGADDKPLIKTTHVYKTVGDVKVEADVYRPEGAEARPVVVWIHGGALIVGGRSQVPKQILELCTRERFVFVSLDYRLAPEVKLPEIAADVQDAFRWL
ncbi:MAG: alpha/beta hydrolase, partial [Planctomycetia bacterium]|nr:alpha/beta hydrolase [Planctomycetia bacterium]